MAKAIKELFLLILVGGFCAWVYFYNQHIIILTTEYKIQISYLAVVLAFLVMFFVFYKSLRFFSWLKFLPKNFYSAYQDKQNRNIEIMLADLFTDITSSGKASFPINKIMKLAKITSKINNHNNINLLCKYLLAIKQLEDKNYQEAEKIAKEIEKEPESEYFFRMIIIRLKMANLLYAEAYEHSKLLLAKNYRTNELLDNIIQICSQLKDIPSLETTLNMALAAGFYNETYAGMLLQNIYYSRAKELFSGAEMDESVIFLKKILKINLSHKEACLLCVEILILQGAKEEAFQLIEKIFRYQPSQKISDLTIKISEEKIIMLISLYPELNFPYISHLKLLIQTNVATQQLAKILERIPSHLLESKTNKLLLDYIACKNINDHSPAISYIEERIFNL